MKKKTKTPKRKAKSKFKQGDLPPLTPQQEIFCNEYIKDRDGAHAYVRAGYSPIGAKQNAYAALKKPQIRYRVNQLIGEYISKIEVDVMFVLRELLKLATVDIQDIYDEDGNLLPLNEMPENARKAISSIEVVEEFDHPGQGRKRIGFTKKVKLWDKTKALEKLGQHLKMFGGDTNIVLPGGKLIYQDVTIEKIKKMSDEELNRDILNRLNSQFNECQKS